MQTLHTVNIIVHVLFGVVALVIGTFAIWTNQQPNVHVGVGRWFLRIMIVVVATAAVGTLLFRPRAILVMLTLLSGYQAYAGYRVIKNRERRGTNADAFVALLTVLVGVGYSLFSSKETNWSPLITYSTLGALLLVTGFDLIKHIWLFDQLKSGWLYEHIYKMLAAYSALLAAFLGTVLPDFQPYSQLGPSVGILGLIAYFILRRIRKQRLQASRVFAVFVIIGWTTAGGAAQNWVGQQAIVFTLSNQFGQSDTLATPPRKVVILAFSNP